MANGRILVILRLILEFIKLLQELGIEANDEEIKKTQKEIKEAVKKWND